nr:colicin E3/pyocin S6 family cytotoxin [uncultured Pseudomonas sp.]
MGGVPRPIPSIFDGLKVAMIESGRKVYYNAAEDVYYTWDALHGEVEVFNRRGRHIGVADPVSGLMIKPAVRGRKINPN